MTISFQELNISSVLVLINGFKSLNINYCAIFLLIAGTYTPFMLVCLRGPMGWIIFRTI